MKRLCVIYRSERIRVALAGISRAAGTRMAFFRDNISLASESYDAVLVEIADRGTMSQRVKRIRRLIEDTPIITFSGKTLARAPLHHLNPPIDSASLRVVLLHALTQHVLDKQLQDSRHRLRRFTQKFDTLTNIVKTANSVLDPKRVTELIMENIQHLIPSDAWSILLVDEANQDLFFELARGEEGKTLSQYRLKVGEGIAGWVAATGQPAIVNDVQKDKRFLPLLDARTNFTTNAILCAPLISRGRTLGVVEIINRTDGKPFTESDLEILLTLVEPAAIALENAVLYQRAKELSITDDLTKLYNSRYLQEYLAKEIKRCRRYKSQVSLIFLDLDGFKDVNDQHGHMVGGKALIEVGAVIKGCVRDVDITARYGGDEFTIVLTETSTEGAVIIAERIRKHIQEKTFLVEEGFHVRLSASLGIATYPEHGHSPEEIIQKADKAMYYVKGMSKNGVAVAGGEGDLDGNNRAVLEQATGHS